MNHRMWEIHIQVEEQDEREKTNQDETGISSLRKERQRASWRISV